MSFIKGVNDTECFVEDWREIVCTSESKSHCTTDDYFSSTHKIYCKVMQLSVPSWNVDKAKSEIFRVEKNYYLLIVEASKYFTQAKYPWIFQFPHIFIQKSK